jgi:spermidine synthase
MPMPPGFPPPDSLLSRRGSRLPIIALLAALALAWHAPAAPAEELIDTAVRAEMLKRRDGRIARIETEFNDIFVNKRRSELTLAFQVKGWDYTETVINLRDPDDLPVRYTQLMTMAVAYPDDPKKILMIGLGGGAIPTYLGRFMPQTSIETVEIDPGVIAAAKKYFGIRDTERVRYSQGDGRVFLTRSKELYDIVLVDAFFGGYVPFHLLTKEFYTLIKQRLAPGGVAAFNVHESTKLYASTVKTLSEVFATIDLFPTGEGEVIVVVSDSPALDRDALTKRAAAAQQRYDFRFPLTQFVQRRVADPKLEAANGQLLTDDFAPVNLYDTQGKDPRRKK